MNYINEAWILKTFGNSALYQGIEPIEVPFTGTPQDAFELNKLIVPYKLKRVGRKWILRNK